jgi:hypothetical protein
MPGRFSYLALKKASCMFNDATGSPVARTGHLQWKRLLAPKIIKPFTILIII